MKHTRRRDKYHYLSEVSDSIGRINSSTGEALIVASKSYRKYCQLDKHLPIRITTYFDRSEQDEFIAEYAKKINVEKRDIGLWDALLKRPILTLKYVRDGIEKINNDAGEALITSSLSYIKNYQRNKLLPRNIILSFTYFDREQFIEEYAKEINVDKAIVGLWDALLKRSIRYATLEYVRDTIEKINDEEGKLLIVSSNSYIKYYKRDKFLPCNVIQYFSHSERDRFITEYAKEIKVDKAFVSLWDTLLKRPIVNVTLEYVSDGIKKINDRAGEVLITGAPSYIKNYQRDKHLPSCITEYFSSLERDEFIAEYAKDINVDKTRVGLWDALLKRSIVNVTLEYVCDAIEEINNTEEMLVTGSDSYRKHYQKCKFLPSNISQYFTPQERRKFIVKYAKKINVDIDIVGLWDALLKRPVVKVTLEYIRNRIEKINENSSEVLIIGSSSYIENYQQDKRLPSCITHSFTDLERDEFIAKYAKEINVDNARVNLWDALLKRSVVNVSLGYVRDAIEKINTDVAEDLIVGAASYVEHYQRDHFLPYSITHYFTELEKEQFIVEYAKDINADKDRVSLWDALLQRPTITLGYVSDAILKINSDADEDLIIGSTSYKKNYQRDHFLPHSITHYFTDSEKDQFIVEYAKDMNVGKARVGLWDALLQRPIITLGYVSDAIAKINSDADEDLIIGSTSYKEYYKLDHFLPSRITHYFTNFEKDQFITEYAKDIDVDKSRVSLWDALLKNHIITPEYAQDAIDKINNEAGKILITSSYSTSNINNYQRDKLLKRPIIHVTLEYVCNVIEEINKEALLITGYASYKKNYQLGKFFPCAITQYFTDSEKDKFIAEYAKTMGVNKTRLNFWDALLKRPVLTLEYIREAIDKINNDAGEALITGSDSYRENCRLDKRLPYNIALTFTDSEQDEFIAIYAKKINLSEDAVELWDALLPKRKMKYTLNSIKRTHPKWHHYFLIFMENQNNISQKERTFRKFIEYFIDEFGYSSNPLVCLAQKEKKIDLNEYDNFFSCFGDVAKRSFHVIIVDFIDFVIADLSGFDNDTEEDEVPLLSNKFNYFENDILQIRAPKFSESNKPRLAFSYIVKAREWIFPESCNNFIDLKHLHNLVDQDWVEVDESQINVADLNCVWRYRKKDNKNSKRKDTESGRFVEYAYEIWMPTRWLMLYTLLQVPIRGVQVTKLDSGEADSYLPIINNGRIEWIANPSKLKSGVKESFIKRYPGEHAGMYVTTNKTSSSQGGYAVPYIPFDLCKWIIRFREFQSTYNPLDKPTLWTEIKLRRKTNAKKLKSMGSQCFLFREMGDVTPMNEAVFRNAFAFVLAQIETEDLKLTKKINDKNTLNSYETVYTPHSLRVSLVSAYITDGKIPIEVVSKIVGHHSLMMTIYYTKIGDGEFKHYLEQAEKNMLKASGDKLALELLEKQLENADENLICNTKNGVEQFTMNWPTSSYFISDIGICPMAGSGCNEGGDVIESTKTRLLYAPVERGYLGERNCPRCRFFMTGVAFTPGLTAVMHRIQSECGGVNEKYKEHTINVKILEDEEYDCEQGNIPFTKRLELAKSIQNKEDYATRLNAHKVDIVAIARLVEMSLSLVNKSDSENKLALVTNNDIGKIGIEYNDSSEFKLFDTVCQDSEIYSIVDATNIAPRRTQLIDAMLQANNVNSALFRMPVQEQLKIGNQVTQLLLKRLGSWDKLNSVAEGRSRLNENSMSVVNSSSMKSITKEVQQLIDNTKCSGQQLEASVATNDDNVIDVKDIK